MHFNFEKKKIIYIISTVYHIHTLTAISGNYYFVSDSATYILYNQRKGYQRNKYPMIITISAASFN
jgi:hypothetical protein